MLDFYAFLRRKWSEYSEASGQKGTVVDELAVKPAGLLISDFYNLLVDQRRANDISQADSWSEDEADMFGAKFFQPRADGDYSVVNVRIWFDEKKDIELTTETRFSASNGNKFMAVQPGFISKNSFVVSTDRFALYYVDVPSIATSKGNSYNVPANDISQIDDANFTYKAVSNPDAAVSGKLHEDNASYIERLLYTVNDKSLLTKRSMFARLPEFFPSISSIYISGPGDKYMIRDLVSGVDASINTQTADYLGKISGENNIKHSAFYGIFPPNVGSIQKERWGPFSVKTLYPFPLSIEATNLTAQISAPTHDPSDYNVVLDGQSGDPAFHGFPLDQEFTNDLYKGLYFDDFKNIAEISTEDLFNIDSEGVGFTPIVTPDSSWVYGAVGNYRGNIGQLANGVSDIDVLNFNNTAITLAGGIENSISVGKDIQKRTGIKLQGTITFPTVVDQDTPPAKSNLQVMVGGINGDLVDGYTGVGFGIRLTQPYQTELEDPTLPPNAAVYFAHGEKYGDAQVFATDADFSDHIGVTDLGALAETAWRIQPDIPYDFEFIIHDDLQLTLFLYKTEQPLDDDPSEKENQMHFRLQSKVLNVFSEELFNKNTDHYGTMMKITLDTESESTDDKWVIEDLKAFDTQQSKAMALCAVDVNEMESPVSIYARGAATSSVEGILSDGYSAYIWDKEKESIGSGTSTLSRGGWTMLEGISNPVGNKDIISALLVQDIQNLDRYRIQSRFGENIFVLFISSGTSKMNSRYFNKSENDIHSNMQVDYIKVESFASQYFHANNKADLYLTTFENSEELETTSISLTKQPSETFFELNADAGAKMPIADVVSITLGADTGDNTPLADTEYTVVRPDPLYSYSSKETIQITLNEQDDDEIIVEYTTYPEISRVQDYFDGNTFGKLYGNILAKHKRPAVLNFNVQYTGTSNEDELVDRMRTYADENNTNTFSPSEMVRVLLDENYANSVQEPIEVTYTRIDEEGRVETGTFTDSLEITEIEFFRLLDVTATKLT